jgi:integrase
MLFWSELDAHGTWTLPSSRNKVKFDLVRPLSKLALSQLVMNGEPRAFFFTNGKITRHHCALLKRSGTKDWRLHDARRACRTLLSRAQVSTEVAERALGHRRPTIERTYDQHKFIDELRLAYERLAQLIGQIVHPQQNIVPMRVR